MEWGRGGSFKKPRKRYIWYVYVVLFCVVISTWFLIDQQWDNSIPNQAMLTEKELENKTPAIEREVKDKIPFIKREIENQTALDCGGIIGKVFDDKNGNEYQDDDEPGLPSIRVTTVNGALVTTDNYGRYHIPCGSIFDANIGSNLILKLDTRTLPTGYRITSQNPRIVRLTSNKLTKLDFAASLFRVVRISLNSVAFVSGSIEPSKALTNTLGTLVNKLNQEPSVLRLSYHSDIDDKKLAKKRMRNVAKLIKRQWKKLGANYNLEIETKIIK